MSGGSKTAKATAIASDNFSGERVDCYDNWSEASYRLSDVSGAGDAPTSSRSEGPGSGADPRVFATTFTTRRVGNVLVKKVHAAGSGGGAMRPIMRQANRDSSGDDDSSCDNRSSAASAPPLVSAVSLQASDRKTLVCKNAISKKK